MNSAMIPVRCAEIQCVGRWWYVGRMVQRCMLSALGLALLVRNFLVGVVGGMSEVIVQCTIVARRGCGSL